MTRKITDAQLTVLREQAERLAWLFENASRDDPDELVGEAIGIAGFLATVMPDLLDEIDRLRGARPEVQAVPVWYEPRGGNA